MLFFKKKKVRLELKPPFLLKYNIKVMEKPAREKIYLIDGSSIIYRAFHAIPATLSNSKGLPTNAIYGFLQSLLKIIKDFNPGYIAVAFDVKGPSFRHEIYTEYKAERPPMPDLLSAQIPYIKRLVAAFRIPVLEKVSFEADDIIATVAKRIDGEADIAIVTGDKDMYQLVDGGTVILDYMAGKEYGPKEVEEKFGVGPDRIRDLLGLAGDASDNIPGVPGVGLKTAAKLLNQFGTFEAIFENIPKVSGEKLKENLKNFKDQALLSRNLASLHPDVPFECTMDDLKYNGPDTGVLKPLLTELEFRKILQELIPENRLDEKAGDYNAITTEGELIEALKRLKGTISFALFLTEAGVAGKALAMAAATESGKAFYLPVMENIGYGLSEHLILKNLKAVAEDDNIKKVTGDAKALYIYFGQSDIELKGVAFDTSIASYLINPSRSDHSIEAVSSEYLGEVAKDEALDELDMESAKNICCSIACNIGVLYKILDKKLINENLKDLYLDLELPLAEVLASMEITGIKVDRVKLLDLSKEMDIELRSMEECIYRAAGGQFNINSPKQLSELLFEKLKLRPIKRTKKGFSTDEEVLTQLAASHEVPALIIGYRQLAKLKSTYVDALLEIVNPATGRVHTSFNQTVTATGRLSSSRPNLQNIPVRGEGAGRIREAFIAEEGFTFLSADYSQIELRLVAHMSEDPFLTDAFTKDEDIHTRTASEVFGMVPGLVTSEMRRRAKAINFGIIYGMGPYGLSVELGISVREATVYIDNYFSHYRKVKEFIDSTVDEASRRGFTVTLFGRRRFIPELKSPVESTVRLGQRLAINTPIQGTAADMIKAAMLKISHILKVEGLRSRMILQIHDELIFESAIEELEKLKEIVIGEMSGVLSLKVPVKVNTKTGPNWNLVE